MRRVPRVIYKDTSLNLLLDTQANAYPDLTGLVSAGHCDLEMDLTRSNNGTGSCKGQMNADGIGAIEATNIPVIAGHTYQFKTHTMAYADETDKYNLEARFYNSGGTLLQTNYGPLFARSEDWTGAVIWETAPTNATKAKMTLVYNDMDSSYSFWWSDASVIDINRETSVGAVISSTNPVTQTTLNYYSTEGQRVAEVWPGCSSESGGQRGRVCHILESLINWGIKYKYYTGHVRTSTKVIQEKVGNCCDLVRLVRDMAIDTSIQKGSVISKYRFVEGDILYNGVVYDHVWIELYVNGTWYTLDPTNFITTGNPSVFGTIQTITNRIYSGNPCT